MTGTEVERILVRLVGDPQLYIKALRDATTATVTFAQKIKAAMAGVSTLAFGLAAAGLTMFFQKAIKLSSDAEETISKFSIVFGDRAKDVTEFAKGLGEDANRSKVQLQGMLASFQDLFVPLGFAAGDAESMSKQLTQLTLDLASFNNRAEPEVLNDLQAAMTGSGEVMKKYGVIVSETTLKQEAINQKMDPKHLTETQKAMLRLSIIMKGTTAAQGDAIRTAGGFANQSRGLAAAMEELTITIGDQLLPTITAVTSGLTAFIKTFIDGFNLLNGTTKQLLITLGSLMIAITALQKGLMLVGIHIGGVGAALNLLMAHPIIAIIAALTALVIWLHKSERGGEGIVTTFRDAGIEIGKMTGQVKILNEELLKTNKVANDAATAGVEEQIIKQRRKLLEAQQELLKAQKDPDANTNYGKGLIATFQQDVNHAKAALAELESANKKISSSFEGGTSQAESGLGFMRGIFGEKFLNSDKDKKTPFDQMKDKAVEFAQRGLKPIAEMNDKIKAGLEAQSKIWQDMAGQAHQMLMDNLSPIEKLKFEIENVQKLIDMGALSPEAGKKAMDRMVGAFAEQGGTTKHTGGAAIEAGTREAYSLTRFGTNQRTTEKGVWELVGQTKVQVKTEQLILAEMKKRAGIKVFSIPGG